MNVEGSVAWSWRAALAPPEPHAAVAWGECAPLLHARLAQLAPEAQARLQATASRDVLVVAGNVADLPWVPGIAYAARGADAPHLWLPTTLEPDVPADLLSRALESRYARVPLLLWHEPAAVVPLDRQQRVSAELLARIAERWRSQ